VFKQQQKSGGSTFPDALRNQKEAAAK